VQIQWLAQHNVSEGSVRPSLVVDIVWFSLHPLKVKLLAL
jgi:hypothetical protein